jgi:hypothetical protein
MSVGFPKPYRPPEVLPTRPVPKLLPRLQTARLDYGNLENPVGYMVPPIP